jgi:hypothetical protein
LGLAVDRPWAKTLDKLTAYRRRLKNVRQLCAERYPRPDYSGRDDPGRTHLRRIERELEREIDALVLASAAALPPEPPRAAGAPY